MAKFVELTVKPMTESGYNTPKAMKSVDDSLQRFGAMMNCPRDLPIQNADGTWNVRVLSPEAVGMVKNLLKERFHIEVVTETPKE